MHLFVSLVLATLLPAAAGDYSPMSEAVEDGHTPVIYGQAVDTRCASYSVSEEGSLYSHFVTEVWIWEVLQEGEGGEILVVGDTIEMAWGRFYQSPYSDLEGCGEPSYRISPMAVSVIALEIEDGLVEVNPWYEGDLGYGTGEGTGEQPPCGEDVRDAVLEELRAAEEEAASDAEDASEPGDSSGVSDPWGGDDPLAEEDESTKAAESGCSVAGSLALRPLLLSLLAAVVAGRRRS